MAKASLALFICRVAWGMPVLGPPWYACWSMRGASCAMLDTVMKGATRATARKYFTVIAFSPALYRKRLICALIDKFGAGCRPVTSHGDILGRYACTAWQRNTAAVSCPRR